MQNPIGRGQKDNMKPPRSPHAPHTRQQQNRKGPGRTEDPQPTRTHDTPPNTTHQKPSPPQPSPHDTHDPPSPQPSHKSKTIGGQQESTKKSHRSPTAPPTPTNHKPDGTPQDTGARIPNHHHTPATTASRAQQTNRNKAQKNPKTKPSRVKGPGPGILG